MRPSFRNVPRAGRGAVRIAAWILAWIVTILATGSGAHGAGRVPIVRIGITPEVARVVISCDGAWRIGVTGGRGAIEDIPAGAAWTFTAAGDFLEARDHRGIARGGAGDTLYLFTSREEASPPMRVDGKGYRGELLVFASGGDRVTVVDVLDIESYLRGVLPEEIGRGGANGLEAVKAQAVAARSYTLAYLNRWRARGFDLLDTVDDQVYGGIASERPETDRALRETCGVVALSSGAPIEAYYSSTCGGMTAAPEEVWGRPARSYLTVHRDSAGEGKDPFCLASPLVRWHETWTGEELERILKKSLGSVMDVRDASRWGRLRDLRINRRSASDRVQELEIAFDRKSVTIGGDRIRWVLRRSNGAPLRSALLRKIEIARSKKGIRRISIDGAGYGHGIGLCQMGALGMANAGYDYMAILHFYYRGAQIVRAYDHCPV